MAALAEAGRRAGVDLCTGVAVERIQRDGAKITGVRLAGGEVVARRARRRRRRRVERRDRRPARAIPLRPVKGQILRLRDPHGPGLLDRIVRFEGGYLVPRGDGRYVLGATMEERGFDTTVTAGGLYELLRDAGELVPGIHELVVEESAAGLRPATPDNAPLLGCDADDRRASSGRPAITATGSCSRPSPPRSSRRRSTATPAPARVRARSRFAEVPA